MVRLIFGLWLALLVPGLSFASEASVKRAMEKKYPAMTVDSVAKTPLPGIYEVFVEGEVLYVDENINYLITRGRLIDANRKIDLTAERLRILTAVKFDELPLELAFRKVQGSGKRKIAYFTDPNCPYCRQLEPRLARLENVTIYFFLYPILGPGSYDKAQAVWCSKDRVKAWEEMMLRGAVPKAAACETPIEKIVAFGRQKSITGTPTLFLADGQRVTGAIPDDQLKKLIDATP